MFYNLIVGYGDKALKAKLEAAGRECYAISARILFNICFINFAVFF